MDSDSSADEQDSFTTTTVLLGYASKDETEDPISHLGGLPQWLLDQPPSAALARCLSCKSLMSLLLQLHADLPERFPGHDRRLHIFACRRKTCQRKPGSVRVLRSTRVDAEVARAEAKAKAEAEARAEAKAASDAAARSAEDTHRTQKTMLGNDLFGGGKAGGGALISGMGASGAKANPFAMGASARQAAGANPFSLSSTGQLASKAPQNPRPGNASSSTPSDLSATFASKARISGPDTASTSKSAPLPSPEPIPHEAFPTDPKALTPYPHLHLEADYEALGTGPPAPEQKVKMTDLDAEDGSGSGGPSSAKDEAATADMLMDETFQKFADRLWHNPEQVLRYEFGGRALLYSEKDAVGQSLAGGKGAGSGASGVGLTEGKGKVTVTGAGGPTGIPRCAGCGTERVFEVQLTPGAIAELEAEEVAWEGMEWATVIVGVCEKDCLPAGTEVGKVGYLEEWAGVQWEESKK